MKTQTTPFARASLMPAAFTLIELLVVIAIIGVIASLSVAAIASAKFKKQESATLAMKAQLELALEDYKKQFGTYPPDNTNAAPHWNSLAYELGGVRRAGANFVSLADPGHTVTPAMLNGCFGLTGLVNDGANRQKSLLNLKRGSGASANYALVANGTPGLPAVMVLLVPAEHPTVGTNVWRYRAYPANGRNPKTYDLWAEIKRRDGSTNIIGNWK